MNLVQTYSNRFSLSTLDNWLTSDWFQTREPFGTSQWPAVNIQETDKAFILELAAPGLSKDDLQVDIENDLISLASQVEQSTDHTANYTRREYQFAAFRRTFSIPENVNSKKIDAQYSDGILTVTLPKKDDAVQETKKSIRIR